MLPAAASINNPSCTEGPEQAELKKGRLTAVRKKQVGEETAHVGIVATPVDLATSPQFYGYATTHTRY